MTEAPAVISPYNAATECTTAREQPHSLQLEKDSAQQQSPSATETKSVNYWEVSGAALGITDKMEARSPAPSPHSAGTDPGIKELGLVILTCLFLSLAELT